MLTNDETWVRPAPESQARLGALLIALASLGLYLLTLAPTVQGFDSAELTMGAFDLGLVHPTGYPLYMLIGHLFSLLPIGEVGLRVNLASAVFASLGNGVLFLLIYRQTRAIWPTVVSTSLFATTPFFWSQAIRAEVYSLHVFLMLCALYAWFSAYRNQRLLSYFLVYVFLGLGLANHLTSILLWVAVLISSVWLDRELRRWTLPAGFLGLCIAGLAYLYFPWRAASALNIDYIRPYFHVDPGSLSGTLWMISGQAFRCLVIPARDATGILADLSRLIGDLLRGTLGFGLLLAFPGWIHLRRSASVWNRLLTLYFVANLIAYLGYGAIDKEVMFIPLYALISIWCACGIQVFVRWITQTSEASRPERVDRWVNLAFLAVILAGVILDWSTISLRNERRTYDFARRVLEESGPSTTIISHWATASVFDYLLIVEGMRPDVTSINADFYFLGIQEGCQPITNQQMLENGWIQWLADLSTQDRLCYIEPLHGLPEGYQWHNKGVCWELVEEAGQP